MRVWYAFVTGGGGGGGTCVLCLFSVSAWPRMCVDDFWLGGV